MAAPTRSRREALDEAAALLGKHNPETNKPWSLRTIAAKLTEEGHPITPAGVKYVNDALQQRGQVGPPPKQQPALPWVLPRKVWQDDPFAAEVRALARVKRHELGLVPEPSVDDRYRASALQKALDRLGRGTVVVWNPKANSGNGGWVLRPRKRGEEPWYGVFGERP